MADSAAAPIDLQPGPQRLAAETKATIVVFGGAAGSGKSRLLVHEAAKFYDIPRYTAVLFRRVSSELKGGGSLLAETEDLYYMLGGELNQADLTWTFASGAHVQLSHMQHDKHVRSWQGKQLDFVGFDEATHFTEAQFWFLYSRLRSISGLRTRFVLTCNPDPDSWVRHMIDWYLGEDGYPLAERSGVVRWFCRDSSGHLKWFDTIEDVRAAGKEEEAESFTFISGKIWDNPILLNKDPAYLRKLRTLPPVEQARFLGGNWNIRAARGDYFQRAWFPRVPGTRFARLSSGEWPAELKFVRQWRFWDLASTPVLGDQIPGCPVVTEPSEMRKDADFSVGTKVGELPDGRLVVMDVRWCRDTDGAVEWWIGKTGESDGPLCVQVIWHDPAQAGDHQITTYKRALGALRVRFDAIKAMNALDVASIASRSVHRGRVLVLDGQPWEGEWFNWLERFPPATKKEHDDHVSSLAGAVVYTLEKPRGLTSAGLLPPVEVIDGAEDYERLENTFRSI